jgi:putative DNA primase/helicase
MRWRWPSPAATTATGATWRLGPWLVWDGQRWRTEDTLAATDLIRSVCRHAAVRADNPKVAAKLASSSTVGGVERLARADRRHAATTEEWDADPWLLNTPGGVVDLKTGRQRPHDRADRMTKITTATPSGDCPTGGSSSTRSRAATRNCRPTCSGWSATR